MKKNYLLALLSAFLLWLGWPPIPYSAPLLLMALVPLLWATENIIRGDYRLKGRKIFLTAGLTGLVWNTASIYWVFNAMHAIMPWYAAGLIALIPFGLAAALIAIAFRLYYSLRKRSTLSVALIGLVCFWIAYEYLHQTWELAFPWITLGNGFANTHQLVQWYEYTGVYGGTLWIWLCNILLFLFLLRRKHTPAQARKAVWVLGLVIFIPMGISLLRYANYEEGINPSDIVVVQPNIDPYGKFGPIPPEQQLETLISLSESKGQTNTEFFVWPETAISDGYDIDEDLIRDHPHYLRIRQFLEQYKNGNVLSGIESYRRYDVPATPTAREIFPGVYQDNFNAAVLIDRSSKVQFYHKSKLVPGVEQTPFAHALGFLKPLFKAFGGTTGGYGSQEKPGVFYAQSGIGAAPVICYESIWSDYVSQYIRQGAQFIAVVTNDGWWGNTAGKDQHLAYAKLRAIETRRWVARSANTGISAFINQRGDVTQKTSWWEPAAIREEINLNEQMTFYVVAGDYIAYAGCLGALVFGLLAVGGRFFKPARNEQR